MKRKITRKINSLKKRGQQTLEEVYLGKGLIHPFQTRRSTCCNVDVSVSSSV